MIVYKVIQICIVSLSLCGCFYKVNVPVWVCPVPNIPVKESLKTDSISGLNDKETLKAFAWDIVYLKGRSSTLEVLLEGYKKPPEDLQKLLEK